MKDVTLYRYGKVLKEVLWVCFSTSCAESCDSQPVFIDQSRKGDETFRAHIRACYSPNKSSPQNLARAVTSFKACFIILLTSCVYAFFKLLDSSYIFMALLCLRNQSRAVLITGKFMYDLWWTKRKWDRIFSERFDYRMSV